MLFRFARLLEEQKDELTELMSREMGKVLAEAGGDVQEAIDMSIYMAGEGRRLFGQTTPSELRDKFQMSVRMPVGVVGAITPWNFPIAIPAWKLAPALVAGNTVVLKPAEDTPLLAERFVELLGEAGLPDGVVNLVHGFGEEAGDRLVRHPDVPIITFTGSRETGVAVTKAAADGLKHVHLELGGKNGIIVMDDADLELAVEGILWSAFGTSGQRCTAASRVIVHEAVYGELQKRLVERAEKMRIGPGWDPETDLGPVINREALDKIHSYTGIGSDEGAKLLTGGEQATDGDLGKGFFYRPTIFADVDPQMRIAQEEIFGPTTALIPVKSFDEAIQVTNGIRYGLSSSIFTATSTRPSARCATCRPGSRTSTPARPAPRCTCPSAAPRTRATATARPARRRSTSSRSGSRSTSTTPASCSARRSTTSSSPEPPAQARLLRPARSPWTRRARRSSPPGAASSATTSAAPGTRRAPARSSPARAPSRRSAAWGRRSTSRSTASRRRARASLREAVDALRGAHPYEELAFDLYPLHTL